MTPRRRLSKRTRRTLAGVLAGTTAAAMLFVGNASAAIVPTVPLGTSANYAVLGGSTVTNSGHVGPCSTAVSASGRERRSRASRPGWCFRRERSTPPTRPPSRRSPT